MEATINLTLKVPKANIEGLRKGKELFIHQGGRASRKTYGNLDTIIYLACQRENELFSIVSETMPHLRRGAMRDFRNLLRIYGIEGVIKENKTDKTFGVNGNTIEFFSADQPDKVRGPRRDWLFVNEVNNIPFDAFDHLADRTHKGVIVDYNPVSEFFIHSEILPYPDLFKYVFTVSTYLDNPFLPNKEKASLEAKRRLAEKSEYWANWWKVYGEGEIGGLIGTVFDNWQQIDHFPDDVDMIRFGLDFGFTNDPTSLVKVGIKGNNIYIDELLYQTGMTNRDISKFMASAGIRKNYDEIFADSAEPKSIEEIKRTGFNVKPSVKGADSIISGIDKMQSYNIFITKRSLNTIKEFRNYTWVKDRDGKATNKPIDLWNHSIDAVRYSISDMRPKGKDIHQLKGIFK